MSTVVDLLTRVRLRGANITLGPDGLRIINRDKLSAEAVAFIRKHRAAIVEHLRQEDAEAEFEERAGILEFDGGMCRADAEAYARLLLAQPPSDVSPADWSWFVGLAAPIMAGGQSRRAA